MRSARYAVSVIKRSNVRPSICLSRRLTAAAATGGFAAEVGREQQISILKYRLSVERHKHINLI